MKYLSSTMLSLVLLGIWSCSDIGAPCSEGLDCFDNCGGSATVDECGVCGGDGKLSGWSSCFFEESMDYSTDIQPIFNNYCTSCHGGINGLILTSRDNVMLGNSLNGPVIISSNYKNSLLWQYINDGTMPDGLSSLTPAQIDSIAAWIDEGALP